MPRTKSRVRENFASLEAAYDAGGELALTRQAARKYMQVIDVTESGRDMKPLMTGLFECIDRLKALEGAAGVEEKTNETPLANVLRMAQ